MIKNSGNNSAFRHNTYQCFLLKNIYSNSTHIWLKKKKKLVPSYYSSPSSWRFFPTKTVAGQGPGGTAMADPLIG
jgi:hypothetical protein